MELTAPGRARTALEATATLEPAAVCDNPRAPIERVEQRSLRDMAHALRDFDGVMSFWRVPVAMGTWLAIRGVPVAAAVVVALVTVHGRVAEAALSALIALILDSLGGAVRARLPWQFLVARRLWTFERPNPATEVSILVPCEDADGARRALRRASFNPQRFSLRLGSPPADRPELDLQLRVQEPAIWAQSRSDEHRIELLVRALEGAGIRARVAGVDCRARSQVAS